MRTGARGLLLRILPLVAFAVVLVLVRTGWTPLRRLDLDVARGFVDAVAPHPAWATFWKVVSTVGRPATWQVLAVLTAAVLVWRRRVAEAIWTVVTVPLAGLLSTVVKWSVDRPRPTVVEPLVHAAGTSFPSGHALSSIVGVGLLIAIWAPRHTRFAVPVGGAGAIVVLLVGASRLALGVHYLSDVVAGWLLGASWLLGTRALLTTPSWPSRASWPGPGSTRAGRPRRRRSG